MHLPILLALLFALSRSFNDLYLTDYNLHPYVNHNQIISITVEITSSVYTETIILFNVGE